jgi:hypothetical protein
MPGPRSIPDNWRIWRREAFIGESKASFNHLGQVDFMCPLFGDRTYPKFVSNALFARNKDHCYSKVLHLSYFMSVSSHIGAMSDEVCDHP